MLNTQAKSSVEIQNHIITKV